MFTSLKDNGRMAVVLDTGAVSRGSGNTGRNIWIGVEQEAALIR